MPMTTTLVNSRPSPPGRPLGRARRAPPASAPRSRAHPGCAPAASCRCGRSVQVSVQPTWVETHKAPRSSSGMNTLSTSCPSAKRSSHLRVPSAERCSVDDLGPRPRSSASPSRSRRSLGSVVIAANDGGTAMVDPVEQLARAQRAAAARARRGSARHASSPAQVQPDQARAAIARPERRRRVGSLGQASRMAS